MLPRFRALTRNTALLLALIFAGCTNHVDLTVNNHFDYPVEIGIGQFQSDESDTISPASRDQLPIQQFSVKLNAKETRRLVLDTKSGAYSLRWRMLNPIPEPNTLSYLDLLHEEPVIDLKSYEKP